MALCDALKVPGSVREKAWKTYEGLAAAEGAPVSPWGRAAPLHTDPESRQESPTRGQPPLRGILGFPKAVLDGLSPPVPLCALPAVPLFRRSRKGLQKNARFAVKLFIFSLSVLVIGMCLWLWCSYSTLVIGCANRLKHFFPPPPPFPPSLIIADSEHGYDTIKSQSKTL